MPRITSIHYGQNDMKAVRRQSGGYWRRRDFLATGIHAGLAALALSGAARRAFAAALPANITGFSALELSTAIASREVGCVEVMQAYLARIHRLNPTYNAIIGMLPDEQCLALAETADAELARGEHRGWMHGMPHAVKDLTPAAGLPYTSGSPMFRDRIAEQDGAVAAAMRAAGAIFIGKTNVPEFGLGSQSYNPVWGATGCAYNPELTSGGSSGGAACGMAIQMLPIADGSDMMGSLRNPGAFNNVIGFRPSAGLVSGDDPFSRALSTSGPMGRNSADTIRLLHTLASAPGPEQPAALRNALAGDSEYRALELSGLRIGWMGSYEGYLAMEPGILALCEANLAALEAEGAIVEPVMPRFDMAELFQCWLDLRNQGRIGMREYYENADTRPLLKPELVWEIEMGYELGADDIYRANAIRRRWYAEINRLFGDHDFLVLPTAQVFPFPKTTPWPAEIDGRTMDTYHRWMEVVIGGSLAGIPVVNLPVGFDGRGRPMGMQVMGPFARDRKVLEFSLAHERITDHLSRRPDLPAA